MSSDSALVPLNEIDAGDLEEYFSSQIYRRLESEPEFLAHSIGEFDAVEDGTLKPIKRSPSSNLIWRCAEPKSEEGGGTVAPPPPG